MRWEVTRLVAQKTELRLKIQKLETLHDAIQNAILDAGGVIPADTLAKLLQCLTELHGARWSVIWKLCDLERNYPTKEKDRPTDAGTVTE